MSLIHLHIYNLNEWKMNGKLNGINTVHLAKQIISHKTSLRKIVILRIYLYIILKKLTIFLAFLQKITVFKIVGKNYSILLEFFKFKITHQHFRQN